MRMKIAAHFGIASACEIGMFTARLRPGFRAENWSVSRCVQAGRFRVEYRVELARGFRTLSAVMFRDETCILRAAFSASTKASAGSIPLITLVPFWADMVPFFLAACAKFAAGEH
jgi:hypothetical protein